MQHQRVEELEARQPRWYAASLDPTVRQEGGLPRLEANGREIRGVVRRWRQAGRLNEERTERAAQTRGWGSGVESYDPPIDPGRLQVLADEARLEQIREDEAYRERMRRIERPRELGERVPPTRPTPQRYPRGLERGEGDRTMTLLQGLRRQARFPGALLEGR